jgi:hypothetical protein
MSVYCENYTGQVHHMYTQRGYFSAKSGLKCLSYYSNIHLKEREKPKTHTYKVDNHAPRGYINQNILYKKELYQKRKGGSKLC